MRTIYYLSSTGWVELPDKIVFPINSTYGIDGGVDTTQLSFYAPSDFEMPVDTPIKIDHDGNANYFIVKDSNYTDMPYPNLHTQQRERLFTVQLKEPMELLTGYKLQACTFAENSYTLRNIISRLCKLAKFDCVIDVSSSSEMNNPRLAFSTTTLYLALYEIARTEDSIPYLDFNEQQKKWAIKFQKLDGLNEQIFDGSILKNPILQQQNLGEGLAKRVYIEASNIQFSDAIIEQVNYFPIATDNSSTITIDNVGLRLPANIVDLKYFKIVGVGKGTVEENTWTFTKTGLKTNYSVGRVNDLPDYDMVETSRYLYVIPKYEYDLLSEEDKNNRQNIYVYYENSIIYMQDLKKLTIEDDDWKNKPNSEVGVSRTPIIALKWSGDITESQPFEVSGMIHGGVDSQALDTTIWNNKFNIEYIPLFTSIIPFLAFNQSKFDDTVFYNQTSPQINPDRTARVLQTYIDNMQDGTLIRTGIFNNWIDFPKEGNIICIGNKNYIVNSLTIVEHIKYYDVTFSLTQFHSKRREYMEANTELQLTEIPVKNVIDTIYLDSKLVKLSINEEIEGKNIHDNVIREDDFIFPSISAFETLQTAQLNKLQLTSSFYYSNNKFPYVFQDNLEIFKMGTNIMFFKKALSNIIWKDKVDTNGNLIPQNYTDSKGKIIKAYLDLYDSNNNAFYSNYLEGNQSVPIKDPYETFNYALQFAYIGINNTIIREELISKLLSGNCSNISFKLYNKNIGRYDLIQEENVIASLSISSFERNKTNQTITLKTTPYSENTYKALILEIDGVAVLIKNYLNEKTNFEIATIYYSIEDGLPVQTAVRPYDYEN